MRETERKREREEEREREREREREEEFERTKDDSLEKKRGKKKTFSSSPDFLLPRLPLPRHRRALLDLRGGQARALGGRDLEVQQGGRQGEHARDEEVGRLGERLMKERERLTRERRRLSLLSTLETSKKRKNPNLNFSGKKPLFRCSFRRLSSTQDRFWRTTRRWNLTGCLG